MSDPDQPFRRPQGASVRADSTTSAVHQSGVDRAGAAAEPVVLDPDFHQSVWKPWDEETDPGTDDVDRALGTGTKQRRLRRTVILASTGVALVVAAALLVPPLLRPHDWRDQPLVVDMFSKPEVSWRSEGGQTCTGQPQEDQAILSDTHRVWALDLRNGRTRWSVDLDGVGSIVCLPGAHLVAVSMIDSSNEDILHTQFLRASSGVEVARLPGAETTHVLPIGSTVGLVDTTNTLRAVNPGDFGTTLWSRALPGPLGELGPIWVQDVDDFAVQLLYYPSQDSPSGFDPYVIPIMKDSGAPPLWTQGMPSERDYHQRRGNVLIRFTTNELGFAVAVLDLQGRKLWEAGDDELVVAGPRIYLASPPVSSSQFGRSTLREVNPRTGLPINGVRYEGGFDFAVAARDGLVAIYRNNTFHLLDDHLEEQSAIVVEDFRTSYEGESLLYTESSNNEEQGRLSAIDTDGAEILWTFDLERGQHLQQMGRHLVLVDEDGTLHGLMSM